MRQTAWTVKPEREAPIAALGETWRWRRRVQLSLTRHRRGSTLSSVQSGIGGLVDLAHPAFADVGGDVVVGESGADFQRHSFLLADRATSSQLDQLGLPDVQTSRLEAMRRRQRSRLHPKWKRIQGRSLSVATRRLCSTGSVVPGGRALGQPRPERQRSRRSVYWSRARTARDRPQLRALCRRDS